MDTFRPFSNKEIDLFDFKVDDVDITDIAWSLGRQRRWLGHTKFDWYVAQHAVVTSYIVGEGYALEALLHDAAEAYVGDIPSPFKAGIPQIEEAESAIMAVVMDAFSVPCTLTLSRTGTRLYEKSHAVSVADKLINEHEAHEFGKGGTFHPDVESAWLQAIAEHEMWWLEPQYLFLARWDQLTGSSHFKGDYGEGLGLYLTSKWFPEDLPKKEEEETVVEEEDKEVSE